jgi:hypothetical protein
VNQTVIEIDEGVVEVGKGDVRKEVVSVAFGRSLSLVSSFHRMKPAPTATLAQLVNQFREKFEGPNVARTCVLIGAGCSYNSKIPLGGGLVTLLQRETFRKLHVTDDTTWPLEDAGKHEQEFNAYLDAKNLRNDFNAFCEAEEKAFS